MRNKKDVFEEKERGDEWGLCRWTRKSLFNTCGYLFVLVRCQCVIGVSFKGDRAVCLFLLPSNAR